MQRVLATLGLTTTRSLLTGWAVSGVLLVVGLVLLLTGASTSVGIVLFAIGAIGSTVVTLGMLKHRAAIPDDRAK